MAVTVSVYNQTTALILSKGIDLNNLRIELLNNTAAFNPAHASKEQVDNGSKATVTISIATPGVITDNAHGFSAGQPVAFLTTGALPSGLTPGVFYYVVNPTTNNYQVALTAGGAAINTTGTQSGVHTRYASGSYETYGNGWIPGGPTLAGTNVSSAALTDATVNDAILSATNPSITATGGSLPPTPAYNAILYDATSMKPLMFISFGQAQQAGITTNFAFLINANGLLNLTV
nr:MAG TPA: hypothetical protein [Caudoviricetes sp.]